MPDPAEPRALWPRLLARVVLGVVLAFVLYLLSAAPTEWLLYYRTPALNRALHAAYVPYNWVWKLCPPPALFLAYEFWWMRLPGGPMDRFRQHPEYAEWNKSTGK